MDTEQEAEAVLAGLDNETFRCNCGRIFSCALRQSHTCACGSYWYIVEFPKKKYIDDRD